MADLRKGGQPKTAVSELDFLTLPLHRSDGIRRDGAVFSLPRPWSLARYGHYRLKSGWWNFECEGDGNLDAVEVRLSTPLDPLVLFPAADSQSARIHLSGRSEHEVSLLVSPWPGVTHFKTLRMRRLDIAEEAAFILKIGKARLGRKGALRGTVMALSRLMMGKAVGVDGTRGQAIVPAVGAPIHERPAVEGASRAAGLKIIETKSFKAVLGGEDRLHPSAIDIVAQEFAASPEVKAIYSDMSEAGVIVPRPQWDSELADWHDFAGLPVFFRSADNSRLGDPWGALKRLVKELGPASVRRVPLPLAERSFATDSALPAVPPPRLSLAPRVSIIIPTKIRVDLLEKCLDALHTTTAYSNFETIIVNNGSENPLLPRVVAAASKKIRITMIDDLGDFNFARLINTGVEHASGEVLLVLNDDVEPLEADWLTRMVESAMRPDVGAVGARLLFPDLSIQHAGIMLGLGGLCGHLWKGVSQEDAARNPYIVYPGARSAVTGACLAVRKASFERVGGFDERMFPVAFNDVDLCLRLNALGLHTVYRGDAVLIHHEGKSRGLDDATAEKRRRLAVESERFFARWKDVIETESFGSPSFDPRIERGVVHRALVRRSA